VAPVVRPAATVPASAAGVRARAVAALRSGRNWTQLIQFCTVGAVGYVVNLAVYAVLLHEGLHYLAAATCSFLVAVTNNYAWNRLWTFRDRRGGVAAQGVRFFLVSLASLGANLVVLHVLITLGAGKLVAQAIAIVLVTPLNFVGNKLWSFRRLP
jgi:putative flippase GtrA